MTAPRSIDGWCWTVLMAALALPVPFGALPVMPERGAILAYLVVVAVVLGAVHLGHQLGWYVGAFVLLTLGHILWAGLPMRGIQILVMLLVGFFLFDRAATLSEVVTRRVATALLIGAGLEAALGVINLIGLYPTPRFLGYPLTWLGVRLADGDPVLLQGFVGRPLGWLTHPNFWGVFMAFAAPVAFVRLGWAAGLAFIGLAASSGNVGPTLSAGIAVLIVAWPRLTRRQLGAAALGLAALLAVVAVKHIAPRWPGVPKAEAGRLALGDRVSALTSGRSAVWATSLKAVRVHPLIGNGPGTWRQWSEEVNSKTPGAPITAQAHFEGLQLVFEWGLAGLVLIGLWGGRLLHGAALVLRCDFRNRPHPEELMWLAVAVAALVNSFGSPTFHMPTQAGVALFAFARLEAATRSS